MSEEIPPSSLTARSTPVGRPVESGSAWTLRTSRERWHYIGAVGWTRAVAVVAGGWALMAWNRFGFQGLEAPRVAVRLVLVGIYAWIGVAALLWLGDRLVRRFTKNAGPRPADPVHLTQVTGLAHQPMLAAGVLLQIGQALRLPLPGVMTTVVVATFLFWMPAVLVAAIGSVVGRSWTYAAGLTAVAYGAWLATAGRFLLGQLQHLI